MTILDVDPDTRTTVSEEIDHLVCCEVDNPEDPTLTLCGQPDTWDGVSCDGPIGCIVCTELDLVDYCPMRFDHHCPWGRDCEDA